MAQGNYRGRKTALKAFLRSLPGMLASNIPDSTGGGVRALWIKLGIVALTIIQEAYILKSRAGTDAAGIKWPPLAPATIRRRLRKANLPTQYRALLNLRRANEAHDRTGRGQKKLAAAKKTVEKVFGPMQILVDTGRLLASFTPGIRSADQFFEVGMGRITVGSNVTTKSGHNLAGIHHRGTDRIPQRKLWPDWDQWPTAWKQQVYDAFNDGLQDMIRRWLAGGTR